MTLRIVPFSESEVAAARAFNVRMRESRAFSDFLLPESAPSPDCRSFSVIRTTQYIALDGEFARGGFLLASYPTWLNGAVYTTVNPQAPLSEGVADRRYSFVAPHLLKFMQRQSPYVFAAGMGDEGRPWPRLLRAAGWSLRPVPFLFRVVRAARFLREIPQLNRAKLARALVRLADVTGAGRLGLSVLHSRALLNSSAAHNLRVEQITKWGSWADEIWDQYKGSCSFAVVRDSRTLEDLYPASDLRILRFLVRKDGRPIAWATAFDTQMQNSNYFGNLRVATILDVLAPPKALCGTVLRVSDALAERGADLLMTNQSHQDSVQAFSRAGFQSAPSNYLFATSKPLTEQIAGQSAGESHIHFARGDSEGRIHL